MVSAHVPPRKTRAPVAVGIVMMAIHFIPGQETVWEIVWRRGAGGRDGEL